MLNITYKEAYRKTGHSRKHIGAKLYNGKYVRTLCGQTLGDYVPVPRTEDHFYRSTCITCYSSWQKVTSFGEHRPGHSTKLPKGKTWVVDVECVEA